MANISSFDAIPHDFPAYPSPAQDMSTSIALQSLAVEVVGVMISGSGLVILGLQLRKKYQRKSVREHNDAVADVEMGNISDR